jgi:hypothetical protein
LTKQRFRVNSWLKNAQVTTVEAEVPKYQDQEDLSKSYSKFLTHSDDINSDNIEFRPSEYFTPGWSGDSLFSKAANNIKKLQETLWQDAKLKLKMAHTFNQKLKLHIHREFISGHQKGLSKDLDALADFTTFWNELPNPAPVYRTAIEEFIELYSFRIATIYIFKLRFLITISKELCISLPSNQVVNPSSFMTKFFMKGSSSEIQCEALRSNQYSWYRPSSDLEETVREQSKDFESLSTSQLMRLFSFRKRDPNTKLNKLESGHHSHALSHKDFGLFINQLLVFFPMWLKNDKFSYPAKTRNEQIDVVNTRFTGDRLESLVHSHWLAQESNLDIKWSELLCADFESNKSSHGTFIQVCQELHFMNFLIQFSRQQNYPPKETIVSVMKKKYSKSQTNSASQESLFSSQKLVHELAYDRTVLNLSDLPKSNPHHYLLTQIQSQKSSLSQGAHLVVLTNQKLFVPSQSQKVETLLKDLKVEGIFNLEKLIGKGEVPNYIYIFKSRIKDNIFGGRHLLTSSQDDNKDSCMSFKFNGKLDQFSMFDFLTKELLSFFNHRSSQTTSIYHKSVTEGLSFQFHLDTVMKGTLLSSSNDSKENITHPNFFKNLTKSCSPLENFFILDDLESFERKSVPNSFLGHVSPQNTPYQNVLIVNLKDASRPCLEIASWDSYPALKEEYGHAYFFYFGLTAKKTNININLLREYLNCQVGSQVIQMCLSGASTKIKGKLSSLLLPNFLSDETIEYNLDLSQFKTIMTTSDDLLKANPQSFINLYNEDMQELETYKKSSPWLFLSSLVHLKNTIEKSIESFTNEGTGDFIYSNPLVVNELINLPTTALHPNSELFTDFHIQNKEQLNLPVSHSELNIKPGSPSILTLYSSETKLISLHGEATLLQFINFILDKAIGTPLAYLLQGLQVPSHHELETVLHKFDDIKEFIFKLEDQVKQTLERSLKQYILNRFSS